jgi:hypothetical protein
MYCVTIAFTYLPLSMEILALGKARSHREPNWAVGVLTDLGNVMLCQKKPAREL